MNDLRRHTAPHTAVLRTARGHGCRGYGSYRDRGDISRPNGLDRGDAAARGDMVDGGDTVGGSRGIRARGRRGASPDPGASA